MEDNGPGQRRTSRPPTARGELAAVAGGISEQALARAKVIQRREGGNLVEIILREGLMDEAAWLVAAQQQYGCSAFAFEHFELTDPATADAARQLTREVCDRYCVLPIHAAGKRLALACVDPSDLIAIDDVRARLGRDVECFIAPPHRIRQAITKAFNALDAQVSKDALSGSMLDAPGADSVLTASDEAPEAAEADLHREASDAPIVRFVNSILLNAIQSRASDIHIEKFDGNKFAIRYRIDGVLTVAVEPPSRMQRPVISRTKIMANLDIAEHRKPQDGRMRIAFAGREVEFRVSMIPTIYGESAVLRILDRTNLELDLMKLGFEQQDLARFQEALSHPHGIILVTGPTGSGKTTTLYSALAAVTDGKRKILTVEDPVEYRLPGIIQTQVDEERKYTFAAALRAFLRQDPDVILVGEIRDFQTAEIAVQAANTGHLVLATIHTNDSASTVERLLQLGLEPYHLTDALRCILAQRLVRRVCASCAAPLSESEVAAVRQQLVDGGLPFEATMDGVLQRGVGCAECRTTGYRGRIAVYEVLSVTERIREAIVERAHTGVIRAAAIEDGMRTLHTAALAKVAAGVTTLEEALRCTPKPKG